MAGKKNEVSDSYVPVKRKRNRPDLEKFGQENVQKGDNARYLRHALLSTNLPVIDISDPKQVEERLNWFFNQCIEDDMKPTVIGMCNALGINRDTLWEWKKGNTRADTHTDLIKRAYAILEELWESYMLNGMVNPASGIFLGRNHWGYQDVVKVQLEANNAMGEQPTEQQIAENVVKQLSD